jgi:hypothetical protein
MIFPRTIRNLRLLTGKIKRSLSTAEEDRIQRIAHEVALLHTKELERIFYEERAQMRSDLRRERAEMVNEVKVLLERREESIKKMLSSREESLKYWIDDLKSDIMTPMYCIGILVYVKILFS